MMGPFEDHTRKLQILRINLATWTFLSEKALIPKGMGCKRQGETSAQYTSTLDLKEDYTTFNNTFGPASGGCVISQVPEGVKRVAFNNAGSRTGSEISEVSFSSVMDDGVQSIQVPLKIHCFKQDFSFVQICLRVQTVE